MIPDKIATMGPLAVSVISLGIFTAAIVVAWLTKDPSLPYLLGAAGTNATTAVGYWLGSSSGSKSKDDTLRAALPKGPTP